MSGEDRQMRIARLERLLERQRDPRTRRAIRRVIETIAVAREEEPRSWRPSRGAAEDGEGRQTPM